MLPSFPFPVAIEALRATARFLSGSARRAFQARVVVQHAHGSPRAAERMFGWSRHAVRRGLQELEARAPQPNQPGQGRKRVETRQPRLLEVATTLLADKTQADPKLKTARLFTRITGKSLRKVMSEELGIPPSLLPTPRTMRRVLSRNGHTLKRVRKTLPLKKLPQTDAIFASVRDAHQRAANDPSILRISIDCKAKVKLGAFSRGGKTRDRSQRRASDHDCGGESITPSGLLEVVNDQLFLSFITGPCTSDAIADQIVAWWHARKHLYPHIKTIMIDLDNGPEVSSRRTQFMNRMLEFADQHHVAIELVYYPPYHSKYNRIERCWGALEQHWNGTLLKTMDTVLSWAATMTWNGVAPLVTLVSTQYAKGVKLSREAFQCLDKRLRRTLGIEKWSVTLEPRSRLATRE